MRTQIGPLLMAAVALSLASCSGSDGDGDTPVVEPGREQITKARLIEQADAICKRDEARASAALAELPRPKPSDGIEAILIPILEINEEAIRAGTNRIVALGTPTSDAELLDEYLEERAMAAYALRTAVAAAKKRDAPEVDAALRTYSRNQAQAAAKRFGFEVCGLGAGRLKR